MSDLLLYAEVSLHDDPPHLLFFREEDAKECASLNVAIQELDKSGITWGEFKEREPEAYNALIEIFEKCVYVWFEDWFEEMAASPDAALRDLKNDPEKAREAFCEEYPVPDRLPFDDETYAIKGNMIDTMNYLVIPECESKMYNVIPDDIVERYGKVVQEVFGEEYTVLEATYKKEIIEELERRGYTCVENEDLVCKAVGWI